MKQKLVLIYLLFLSILSYSQLNSNQPEETLISKVLDDFHNAASKADSARYFNHFTEDAVFLGTDATERWTIGQFKEYAKSSFSNGIGWTYTAKIRHIYVSDDKNTSWFDELLSNANYGECRGSGVLVKQNGVWKIAQYNLTIPVPNSIAHSVVKMIREEENKKQENKNESK